MEVCEQTGCCKHATCHASEGFVVCCECATVVGLETQDVEWIPGVDDGRQRASRPDEDWHVNGSRVGDKRLQKLHQGLSGGSKQRVYAEGRDFIRDVCVDLNLSDVVQAEALYIFSHVRDEHAGWRGAKRIGTLVACVSVACQKLSVGVKDAAILNLERVRQPAASVNKQKTLLLTILFKKGIVVKPACASTYSYRVCYRLGFSTQISHMVSVICAKVSRMERLNGRPPDMMVAMAVLYLVEARNLCLDVDALCGALGVKRNTLVRWYAEFIESNGNLAYARHFVESIDSKPKKICG